MLETIRNLEINDDERMTELYLRNLLYTYRADALKDTEYITEEVYQDFGVEFFMLKDGYFQSTFLPPIIYNSHNSGISIYDYYGTEVPVSSKEEALNGSKRRFYNQPYSAYVNSGKLFIIANLKTIENADESTKNLLKRLIEMNDVFDMNKEKIQISCILVEPSAALDYDWKVSTFPFPAAKLNSLKQNILRKEFGIMFEVKKDEIQNARADNIIYQDESKLYK